MDYLKKLLPSLSNEELQMVREALDNNGIHDNIHRTRYFWTQVLFETGNFKNLKESLRYTTPERLVKVFPRIFNLDGSNGKLRASDYISSKTVNNSQKLANVVYMDKYRTRAGSLGNTNPGDGWKFIGRGAMHLTGRTNYTRASYDIYSDDRLVQNPDLVSTNLVVAIDTAIWFWVRNKLNTLSDNREFSKVTRIVNGSEATVPERKVKLAEVTKLLESYWS